MNDTAKDAASLLERLRLFAIKWRFSEEDAFDLASGAWLSAYLAGVPEWHYASACLKNAALQERRNRRRRNLDYQWTFLEGESEPEEIRRLATPATQQIGLELSDVRRAIEAMQEPTRTIMGLVAEEYTQEEVATETGIDIKEVRWRIAYARKGLREAGHREQAQRGHRRFVGIRKDCRKWSAQIRQGADYYHLGYFDTDEQAARAYDEKARFLGLPEEGLNFPIAKAA